LRCSAIDRSEGARGADSGSGFDGSGSSLSRIERSSIVRGASGQRVEFTSLRRKAISSARSSGVRFGRVKGRIWRRVGAAHPCWENGRTAAGADALSTCS
jgi:hypothetical protein